MRHDNTHLVSCLSHFNFTYMEICKRQRDQTDVLECVCERLRRRAGHVYEHGGVCGRNRDEEGDKSGREESAE